MIDPTKLGIHPQPSGVQTRDGREVVIYRIDAPGFFPIHGAVRQLDGGECPFSWTMTGAAYSNDPNCMDLIPTPVRFRREGWVNVYEDTQIAPVVWEHRSQADSGAKYDGAPTRIACIRIIIEGKEGDGLGDDAKC